MSFAVVVLLFLIAQAAWVGIVVAISAGPSWYTDIESFKSRQRILGRPIEPPPEVADEFVPAEESRFWFLQLGWRVALLTHWMMNASWEWGLAREVVLLFWPPVFRFTRPWLRRAYREYLELQRVNELRKADELRKDELRRRTLEARGTNEPHPVDTTRAHSSLREAPVPPTI